MDSIRSLRIVFFGTPAFAVASLRALLAAGANVVAVVTAADKKAGRGLQESMSPVKEYAVGQGLPVLQPESMKAESFLTALRGFHADLQVVVAFRMMPEAVWNMPPMGTINVHASLLPHYRGAAPINHAIINGETVTGVTTFRLLHEIDTGNLLMQKEVQINAYDDAGSLHDRLMAEGADLLVATVQGLAEGTLSERPQILSPDLRHAPKIFKEDTIINWTRPVRDVHNFVRGLSPYPAASTDLNGKKIRIFKTRPESDSAAKKPGTWDTDHATMLRFAAADGWVYIDELQAEGKKRMNTAAFLRGFRLAGGRPNIE